MTDDVTCLASYRRTVDRLTERWPAFRERRTQRLQQQGRFGDACEKVAEDIVQELFTEVLDWTIADLNNQVGYADLLLSRLSVKHLLIEMKRPGALAWNRRAIDAALAQARGYADRQKVRCIAVSDGAMLYAADVINGGCRPRVFATLDAPTAPLALWWLSSQGIWRPRADVSDATLPEVHESLGVQSATDPTPNSELLHPKYKLPCRCFAYVGDATNPATWKLPFQHADGTVDIARLPKAIQSILSNYRGANVHGIPENAIPDVLTRLAAAAGTLHRLPYQCAGTAQIYVQLVSAMEQFGKAVSGPSEGALHPG